jgi:hypothetical protein
MNLPPDLACPELLEGLSFFFNAVKKEPPFDKLRAGGIGKIGCG